MPRLLEVLLHPYETPGVGKVLGKLDPGSKYLDERIVRSRLDYDTTQKKRKGGKVKKYARGGGIEVRGKTKCKFYAEGGKVSDAAKNDKLATDFLNQKPKAAAPKKPAPAPKAPKKFARGGGIELRGKTRGKFI